MIRIHSHDQRFHTRLKWLDSYHTFSFGHHHDPKRDGFRKLRVINDDRITGGAGFDEHGHRDMEIISYVLDGALEHKDSMGNGAVIRPGDVQRMSAGTGVRHSEFNSLPDRETHFLQIWIFPERDGMPPSYEQQHFSTDARRNRWTLIASRDGRDGSVTVHQDVALYATIVDLGVQLDFALKPQRHAWLHVAQGNIVLNGTPLQSGDGAEISEETKLVVEGKAQSDLLLFDLA